MLFLKKVKNKDAVATQLYFFLNKAVVKQH